MFLQSGFNENSIATGTKNVPVISLTNTEKSDLLLDSICIKYDSTVSGLLTQKFNLHYLKGDRKLLSIGDALILGIEATPLNQSFERIIKIKDDIIIQNSDGIVLKLYDVTTAGSIAAGSILMRVELKKG